MKIYEVGFEFVVFNDRFENGKKTKIQTFHVRSKSFLNAVHRGYEVVKTYLERNYDNYELVCFDVEVM